MNKKMLEAQTYLDNAIRAARSPDVSPEARTRLQEAVTANDKAIHAVIDAAKAIIQEAGLPALTADISPVSTEPVEPKRSITLAEYDWLQPTWAAVGLSKWTEDGEDYYTVHLLLWSDINGNEEFPLLLETEIGDECKNCAARMGLEFAWCMTDSVNGAITIVDAEGNTVEELDADEIAGHGEDEEEEFATNPTPTTYLH